MANEEAAKLWNKRPRIKFSPRDTDKAIEYQQVAGLLCMDIDVLVDCCECEGMTAEVMLLQIRDLQDKKDELIRNKEVRESRYAAAMLFAVASR